MSLYLVFEYSNWNNESLTEEIQATFPDASIAEVNSFGADTIVQAIVSIATAMFASSAVANLLLKLIRDKNVSVKYDGVEISGDHKNVAELIEKIETIRKDKEND